MDANVVTIIYSSSEAEILSLFLSWATEGGIAAITEAGCM